MSNQEQHHQVLAVIPARGGSKGIPRKNIVDLAGKPLLAYTVAAALAAVSLSRVVVSTDDEEIARVALREGAEVPCLRPAALAGDNAPTLPVILDLLRFLEYQQGYRPEFIVVLQPTSPLRQPHDIDQAVSLLRHTGADSVASVAPVRDHPYLACSLEGDRLHPFIPGQAADRRQDFPPVYRFNGAVYVTRRTVLLEQGKLLGTNTAAYVMPPDRSVDIDDHLDLLLAQAILEAWQHSSKWNQLVRP